MQRDKIFLTAKIFSHHEYIGKENVNLYIYLFIYLVIYLFMLHKFELMKDQIFHKGCKNQKTCFDT